MTGSDGGRSFLSGLSAGLVAILVALLLRLVLGVPSPPELLVDPTTLALPPRVFEWALITLEYSAKPLLIAGLLALELLLAGLFGVVWYRLARTTLSRVRWWHQALGLSLLMSVVSWLVFLPLVGEGLFGLGRSTGAFRHPIATFLTNAAYALVLVANNVLDISVAQRQGGETARARRRRHLLAQIGVGALVAALASALTYRRLVQNLWQASVSHATGVPDEVTPNASFYVVSKNIDDPMSDAELMVDPIVDEARWTLEIGGLVERPLTLTYEQLRALPAVEQYHTLCCISNVVGGPLLGNALWKGVPLKSLLDLAAAKPGVRKVVFHGADNYRDSVPWAIASRASNLLAWAMNGETLPREHGFPARLLIPNHYGIKNVKWLTKVELADYDFRGYWQQRFWSDSAVVKTMSRIDVPTKGETLPTGPTLVGGIAFAGDRGIVRVEISDDDGQTWHQATVKPTLSPNTWALWSATWIARLGRPTLRVRATDGTGQVQTSVEAGPLPDGATGHHMIAVSVVER